MSDDGIIRIGTEVDVSTLRSGMAEAASVVRSSTSQMSSAYQQLATATVAYADQQVALRQTIKLLGASEAERAVALRILPGVLQEQASATRALQVAKAALITTETAETEAVKSNISARMAASAELRVLEGNLMGSTRAAGAFLNLLPGIGAAMQAAFPVFGALALASVVVDLGEKLYKAFDIGGERARATQEAIRGVTQEIDRSTTSLDVQIDRLQQEQAKLELKPFNGLKLVLDEASEAAQNLADRLDSIVEKESKAIAGMSGSIPQQLLGQSGSTKYEQTMLSEHAKWIGLAKTQQDQLNESASYGNSLLARQKELEAWIKDAGTNPAAVAGYRTELQAIQQMVSWQQQEQENIKKTIDLKTQEAATQKARDAHGDQSIANKAAEERRKAEEAAIQGARDTLESMKAVHTMTAVEESQYWAGLASTAQFGSKAYTTYLLEANRATAKAQQENTQSLKQWGEEAEEQYAEQIKASSELAKQQDALASAVQESADRMSEAQAKAAQTIDEASLHAIEGTGGVTKLSSAQEQARIHAEAYRQELERLDAEITRVNSDMALTPEQRTSQNGQLQAQKIQLQGQASASAITDQAAIQQQIANPYLQAFSQINQGWLQVQNKIFYSTRNLSLEFAKMGQQIFISIVDNFEKAALIAIEKELVMTLAHRAAVTQNVATDATGAAASQAISSASATIQGLNAAKLAFKNTYAAVSGWPFVGPILAPVLASAAFVAVAAFEDGTGYVPRDGMAYLHEGEAVVPAPTVQELRGSDGGSDVSVNQTNHFHGFNPDKEFQRQLDRNAAHVARAVQKHVRQAGRS